MVHDHVVVMATKEHRYGNQPHEMYLCAGIKIRASLYIEEKLLDLLTSSYDREQSVSFDILARSADETFIEATVRATDPQGALDRLRERLAAAILPGDQGLDMEKILKIEPLFPKPAEARPVVTR